MHIPAYLRAKRKGTALTQGETSFLLGNSSHVGTKVSRHEQSSQLPSLETAIAYEIIFCTPVKDLFAGLYEEVKAHTLRRVCELIDTLHEPDPDQIIRKKLEHLERVIREHV